MSTRILRFLFALTLALLAVPAQAGLVNQLKNHPSPYLAMHGEDPVHWQTWGAAVLAKARAGNKLLYISSGYFSCHWCHVMQRESYRNPEIAARLNDHFVPVKVDRELQPALDAYLIDFVQRTRGSAGWPLNVFLTPEGYPVFGMTYMRPQRFSALLDKLYEAWEKDGTRLKSLAREAVAELARSTEPEVEDKAPAPRLLRERLTATALTLGDDMEGGFGRQNRFPMAPQLLVLLDSLERQPDPRLARFLGLTLDHMATQGMRDHLAGGFFRYTVDPGWQTPHFEKMLYTQAQLIALYIKAARVLEQPDYLGVARDTLEFVLRDMQGTGGAYIASFSAVDAAGEEGGNYLWDGQELARVLSPDELSLARRRWGLEGKPGHAGGYLPVLHSSASELAAETGRTEEAIRQALAGIKAKLLRARARRPPLRDGKQLAAWNGLMLSALAQAAVTFDEPRYREAARRLRDYLVGTLWDGNRLMRARTAHGALGKAALQDYVYVAKGISDFDNLTDTDRDAALVLALARQAWKRFYDGHGWRGSDDALLPGQPRETALADGPMPSPIAMLIELSLGPRLQPRPEDLRGLAQQALRQSRSLVIEQPFWYATQLAAVAGEAAPGATTD